MQWQNVYKNCFLYNLGSRLCTPSEQSALGQIRQVEPQVSELVVSWANGAKQIRPQETTIFQEPWLKVRNKILL